MENKYYTPEISEFYAGFEYEYKPRAREGLMSYVRNNFTYINRWDKDVFNKKSENFLEALEVYDRPYNIGDIYTYIEDKAVRVKYLDKEDIESFGFESPINIEKELYDRCIINDIEYLLLKEDYTISKYKNSKNIQITVFDRVRYNINGGKKHSSLFKGVIKNKSELKKILQMIRVL